MLIPGQLCQGKQSEVLLRDVRTLALTGPEGLKAKHLIFDLVVAGTSMEEDVATIDFCHVILSAILNLFHSNKLMESR
jgi:hypothetical protein